MHPVDRLSPGDKFRIYYSRVADLAVVRGLLINDAKTEIGHFAFSRYYSAGKDLDGLLQEALHRFKAEHPDLIEKRRESLDKIFAGAVEDYFRGDSDERLELLIRIGASYRVWPTGTSFALTYPWDLDGKERIVQFRSNLTEFARRRIVQVLRKAGKLCSQDLFSE
jgi:hypothetical protein